MRDPDPSVDAPLLFVGDSITEQWSRHRPSVFAGGRFLNRGLGGQTTRDVRARFADEIDRAQPSGVHLMAGLNDVAGNGGPMPLSVTQENLAVMIDEARTRGCRVLVGSVTPADIIAWNPHVKPAEPIIALNTWLLAYARTTGAQYVDYHAALRTPGGGLRPGLGPDGSHLNAKGYRLMEPLLLEAASRCFGRDVRAAEPSLRQRVLGLLRHA